MKLVLVVNNKCPNCKYLIKQLKKINVLDKIEVITDREFYLRYKGILYGVPELLLINDRGKIEDQTIVPGNLYGVSKILLYLYKYILK